MIKSQIAIGRERQQPIMLDQFLTRIFSSWLVFAILALILLALAEFGWRVGLARTRSKLEKNKDAGSVPTARGGLDHAG